MSETSVSNLSPSVSIVVPVFNGEKTIDLCISSLKSLDYPEDAYEVIIVDGGSTDGTLDILKSHSSWTHIRLLNSIKQGGPSGARNKGIESVNRDVIAFTDADCIVTKTWLRNLVRPFQDPEVGGVAGEVVPFEPKSIAERYVAELDAQQDTLNHPFLPYSQTANVAYRAQVFKQIGGFDENLVAAEDADIAWRMQQQTTYKLVAAPDAVVMHQHRATLKGLVKQEVWHGYGAAQIEEKYRLQALWGTTASELKMIAFQTVLFIGQLIAQPLRKRARLELVYPGLEVVRRAAYQYGRLKARMRGKAAFRRD